MKASINYCADDKLQERIADTAAALETAARAAGYALSADGRVSEQDAAALLGLASKTLRNWRSTTAPIPWHRIGGPGGRVTYRLQSLAEHVEGGREAK